MLIKNKKPYEIPENLTTAENIYHRRREVLKTMGIFTLALSTFGISRANDENKQIQIAKDKYPYKVNEIFKEAQLTPYEKASTYNNFYEFGFQKSDPYHRARSLKTEPWSVVIDGEVEKPTKISLEDILKKVSLEERIYRFRCVEAWSMNIPWLGFELNDLLKLIRPKSNAKFILFETLKDDDMPGVKNPSISAYTEFPYKEGLRFDEARNPLTMLVVGMYGKAIPNQNGAPLRLIVPWKYGFKSIKSIVRISLVEKMPVSTWMKLNNSEYGFYANVNPNVSHPRWSQASERFIGEGFSFKRIPTQLFNGYAEEVASIYAKMDLRNNF